MSSETSTARSAEPSAPATTSAAATHFAPVAAAPKLDDRYVRKNAHFLVTTGKAQSPFQVFESDDTSVGKISGSGYEQLAYCDEIRVLTTPDDRTRFYALNSRTTPAAGLQQAMREYFVTVWDEKLTVAWETRIASEPATRQLVSCSGYSPFGATLDGKWIVATAAEATSVLDVAAGAARRFEHGFKFSLRGNEPQRPLALGNYIALVSATSCACGLAELYDPANLQLVASHRGDSGEDSVYWTVSDVLGWDKNDWFADGRRVVARVRPSGWGDIQQYQITDVISGQRGPVWSLTKSNSNVLVHVEGAMAFIREYTNDKEVGDLHAYSADTGAELWVARPGVREICAVGRTRINVVANNQMVLLDRETGKQADYTTAVTRCDIPVGEFTFNQDGSVYRLLD